MYRKLVVGVFLDIQVAFDTKKTEAIKEALEQKGINPLIYKWSYNYITHRNVKTTQKNEESATGTISIRFPQGGVCSAKFWIIAFNEAINMINQYGIKGTGFADDCSLLLHRSNPQQAVYIIQRVPSELLRWGVTVGLKFNPQKKQ